MRWVLGDFVFSLKCTHKQCIVELTPVLSSLSYLNMDFKLSESKLGNKCIILDDYKFLLSKTFKKRHFELEVQLNPVKNL